MCYYVLPTEPAAAPPICKCIHFYRLRELLYIDPNTHTHTQMLLPVFRRFALGCNNFSEEWKRWPFVVESNYFDIRPWYCRNLHRYKSQAVAAIILSSLIRLSPGVWATLNLFISHYGRDICMPFIDWSFNLESPEASRGVSSSSLLYTSPPLHTTACTQREREKEKKKRLDWISTRLEAPGKQGCMRPEITRLAAQLV